MRRGDPLNHWLGAGLPGEPLMDGDDGPVILLDLLLFQRQRANQGNIESFFNAREISLADV